MHPSKADESYYAEVEAHFVNRRGSPLFMTPSEWQLVWRWEQEGIPLHVVKDGIDRVFERPHARLKPRKLGYCRQTVEAGFRRFRELRLGAREAKGDDAKREDGFDGAAHLETLAARLREIDPRFAEALESEVERTIGTLSNLANELRYAPEPRSKLQSTEEILQLLEAKLIELAESVVPDELAASLRGESESSLRAYRDRMPEKVYASALASAYRRRLRQSVGLVRLSLFDR